MLLLPFARCGAMAPTSKPCWWASLDWYSIASPLCVIPPPPLVERTKQGCWLLCGWRSPSNGSGGLVFWLEMGMGTAEEVLWFMAWNPKLLFWNVKVYVAGRDVITPFPFPEVFRTPRTVKTAPLIRGFYRTGLIKQTAANLINASH